MASLRFDERPTVVERPWVEDGETGGPFSLGEIVADAYRIVGVLGQGGMGVVYEAEDLELGRRVAIKTALASDQRGALQREGRALAVVRATGLPAVFAAGTHRGHHYLVMERLRGRSLEGRMQDTFDRGHRFEIPEVIDTLRRIADALSAAHAAGVAHRDLKPGNIMVCGSRLVLVDFGLFVPECEVENETHVAGSTYYMAPEVLTRSVRPGEGPAIDLYGLGVVGFELLAGRPPFMGNGATKIAMAHVHDPIPDVRVFRPDTPPALAEIVHTLLQKRPEDRPEGAEAVVWQLNALADHRGESTLRKLRVVLVDDDEDILRILERSLHSVMPGIETESFSDARQALERLERSSADVVMLDLDMPHMSGVELTIALQAFPAGRRPRVIALTAAPDPREFIARSIGVWDFLPKDGTFVSAALRSVGEVRRALA